MVKKIGKVMLAVILLCVILLVGVGIYYEVMQKNQSREAYEPKVSSNASSQESQIGSEPFAEGKSKSRIDFEAERKSFKDIIGQIKLESVGIDYPIVQGEDNAFYLEHLATGEKNIYGSIFLDYRCDSDFSSEVSVIYGHDASNGTMFGSLEKYESKEFYDENKSYQIFAPSGDFEVEIFAGYLLKGETGQYPGGFEDEKAFDTYIKEVKEKSLFESETEPRYGDRLVILSTCSSRFEDARLAIVGVARDKKA